jgi:hypothetical protein
MMMKLLKEPSTWRGIIWIFTALGIALTPEQSEAVIACGMAFAGALGAFIGDK